MAQGLEILEKSGLAATAGYVGGAWCAGDARFPVKNPATGAVLTEVADLGAAETAQAIDSADQAMRTWGKMTAKERSVLMRRWAGLILDHQEDLARLMTLENGKVLAESRLETALSAAYIEWGAEEGRRIYGDIIPSHRSDARLLVIRQAIGVVGVITPWNFPSAMLTRKAGAILGSGCPLVAKPAAETPLSALALAVLAEEAGLPAGTFNIVPTAKASAVGEVLTLDPRVRAFSFTGSTAVGKQLLRQCADTVKKTAMELGGNAPLLVFDDADLETAIAGTMMSKFRNGGQTCICPNRIFVQAGIYDDYINGLAERAAQIKVGNGLAEGMQQGPLINEAAVEKVIRQVKNAKDLGGEIVCGGDQGTLGGCFHMPTVIAGAKTNMEFACEETFGPLAPVVRFESEAEALQMANDTPFGLAAYAFTQDLARAFRVSEGLESGMVSLNAGVMTTEVAPFGGYKESGLGREGSHQGTEEFTETKYIQFAGL